MPDLPRALRRVLRLALRLALRVASEQTCAEDLCSNGVLYPIVTYMWSADAEVLGELARQRDRMQGTVHQLRKELQETKASEDALHKNLITILPLEVGSLLQLQPLPLSPTARCHPLPPAATATRCHRRAAPALERRSEGLGRERSDHVYAESRRHVRVRGDSGHVLHPLLHPDQHAQKFSEPAPSRESIFDGVL